MRNRGKTLKGDEDGVAVVMETGLYGNSLLFFSFFFPQPDGGWSADCVSVRRVCGYETSEKNNNKRAHISILRLNMNMSIPSCSTVQTRRNAVMMLSRITVIITAVMASLAIYQNNRRMFKVHLCNVVGCDCCRNSKQAKNS